MAIKITENGVVRYENGPNVDRLLFPNVPGGYASPEQITQAVDAWLEDHPEATTTVTDGSINRVKLDSELNSYIEDIANSLDSVDTEIGELKENLSQINSTINMLITDNANYHDLWVQGSILPTNGAVTTSPSRIRTKSYLSGDYITKVLETISTTAGHVQVFAYQPDGTYIGTFNGTGYDTAGKSLNYVNTGLLNDSYKYLLVYLISGEYVTLDNYGNVVFTTKLNKKINDIETAQNTLASIVNFDELNSENIWEQGALVSTTGAKTTQSARIRTKSFLAGSFLKQYITSIRATDGGIQVFAYQSDGTYVGTFNGTEYDTAGKVLNSIEVSTLSDVYLYKIVLLKVGETITPDKYYYVVFDSKLSSRISGMENSIGQISASQKVVLRIASFNVGKWYNGTTIGCPEEYVAQRKKEWFAFMGSNRIDIMACQEFIPYFDENETIKAFDEIVSNNFTTLYQTAETDQDKLVTNISVSNFRKSALDGSPSGCWESDCIINGKNVHFIQTHLSTEEALDGNRATSIQALITKMSNYQYCILAGDFNIRDISEWTPFINAGYKLANNGIFGAMDTLISGSAGYTNKCIDNVICTSNIKIRNAYVPNVVLSDHAPMIADLFVF